MPSAPLAHTPRFIDSELEIAQRELRCCSHEHHVTAHSVAKTARSSSLITVMGVIVGVAILLSYLTGRKKRMGGSIGGMSLGLPDFAKSRKAGLD